MTQVRVGGGSGVSRQGTSRQIGTYAGTFDPSVGLPTTGTGLNGAILKGDYWKATGAGTISALVPFTTFAEGDLIYALLNNADAVGEFVGNKGTGGGGGSGDLLAANNLSDVANAATALSNLGGQPLDSDLTAIAALSTTAFGRTLLTLSSFLNLADGIRRVLAKSTTTVSTTGIASEVLLASFPVSAGTIKANDIIKWRIQASKSGSAGVYALSVRVHTLNQISGSTLVSSYTNISSAYAGNYERQLTFKNSVASFESAGPTSSTSVNDNSAASNVMITFTNDFANEQYIILTATPAAAADTVSIRNYFFEIIR